MYKTTELFDLKHTVAEKYLSQFEYPWQALSGIKQLITEIGKNLPESEYNKQGEDVWIHKEAEVFPSAYIGGPCIIGKGTQVRQCAFIRSVALIGENCVIGNSTEIKNAIIFDNVQVPHFNYVGDSILGYKSHLGAGAVTSNVKSDKSLVKLRFGDEVIETKLKKFGAMVGDFVEVGCNSVLNPGTVIGKNSNIYPLSSVRGVVAENSIFKAPNNIVTKEE
ncbi:MAG: UDP-N-acetylglucosamine pyrophosphorylase [Acutalibacteraceae bacterium]